METIRHFQEKVDFRRRHCSCGAAPFKTLLEVIYK